MRSARACAAALLLAGCSVGPDFTPPKPPAVPDWKSQAAGVTEQSDPDPRWWNSFRDPGLTALINQAIAGNLDVQQAMLRVVEARESVATAMAAGLPGIDASGSFQREQLGLKGLLESEGAYGDLNKLANRLAPYDSSIPDLGTDIVQGGDTALNSLAAPTNIYQYGLDASWELDLFGKVRRSVEEAKASAQAQAEQANDSLVLLESEVATTYVQLRAAQALRASAQENVRAAAEALDLTTRRQQSGLTTELDVDQARTELDQQQQQLPDYDKQEQQAINQLDVLTGQAPGTLDAMLSRPSPLPQIPALVGVGVPASLARRRPDIREAEAQLHAATAAVGVAVANFYPDISLTGEVGFRALDASYLTNWASLFYSFGPTISLPIFQGGRLSSSLRLARAQAAGAALNYRATVLNALREVENALVGYRADRMTRDRTADSLNAADLSYQLAQNQYEHGLASFITVLNAEQTDLQTRQQLVQANAQLASDIVALYRALGGGWEQTAGKVPVPPTPTNPPPLPAAADAAVQPLLGSSQK